jgi:hypothetical protein
LKIFVAVSLNLHDTDRMKNDTPTTTTRPKNVCFQLQHRYNGTWVNGDTSMSSDKWAWDLLMGRLRQGEADPREGSHRLQPVVSDKHDWVAVSWDSVTMSISKDFFLK